MASHSNFQHIHTKGFTLLEMVIVIGITAVVGVSLTSMIVYFYKTNDYVLQETQAVHSAQQGITTSMQYLREASYGADGSYPVEYASTSTLIFFADIHNDGTIEQITYSFANGNLYEGITPQSSSIPPTYVGQPTSTTTIATYVVNTKYVPVFEYTDFSGNTIATTSPANVSNVASVITTLKIDVDPSRSPSPYTIGSTATLRTFRGQ
jgi:prepilin-type N-terminal cleavage/methylation domain-containing protein